MRARNICEYVMETPYSINAAVLKQMLNEYATTVKNELSEYTIDVDIDVSTDLLGKTIDDLQVNVFIDDGKFYGQLYCINDYTQFGAPDEKEGHYLAFHLAYDGADSIKINGKALDEDGIVVKRFKSNTSNETMVVEIIKDENSYTDIIDFSGLEFIGMKE